MKDFNIYAWVSLVLLIIGGINWGLVGLFNVNLVSAIFGMLLGRLIFILVGVAGGYMAYLIYQEKMKKPS